MKIALENLLSGTNFWLWAEVYVWAYSKPDWKSAEDWLLKWSGRPLCPKCRWRLTPYLETHPIEENCDVFEWCVAFHHSTMQLEGNTILLGEVRAVWKEVVVALGKVAARGAV